VDKQLFPRNGTYFVLPFTSSKESAGMGIQQTFYEVMREHGITRRNFLKFCSLTAAGLGLGPGYAGKIAHALETKPRTPVIWLHGLECTCCTESFIRSGHPLAGDVILQ
jgi:hydrogenase small subunit